MKPIVNILWIYIIDVLSGLDNLVFMILSFTIIASIVGIMWYLMWRINDYTSEYEEDVEQNNTYLKNIRKVLIGLIILMMLNSLIPSEKTMYTMFVASYVTEENIKKTGETATDIVDYIFERADELNEEVRGESND